MLGRSNLSAVVYNIYISYVGIEYESRSEGYALISNFVMLTSTPSNRVLHDSDWSHAQSNPYIRESVDSLCRDGTDTPIA